MIFVDTSIVIDYARGKDLKLINLLQSLPVGLCGVTRAETLCGVRDSQERGNIIQLLSAFQQILIPDRLWDEVGNHLAMLKSKGINVPFQDVVIATVGNHYSFEVWTRDLRFKQI